MAAWPRGLAIALIVWSVALADSHARAESDGNWVDHRKLGPIFVRAEFRLDNYDALFDAIKEQQADVAATLGLKVTERLIVINLFENRRSYLEYMTANEPLGIKRRALFVQKADSGHVYLYRHPAFETDLRHEVTHAMLHAILPFIPLWLDEGLAEYFEAKANARASDSDHQSRLKWSARLGWKPDMVTLESKDDASEFTMANYRESWAWVHFMLHGPPEANQLLRSYLRSIQQNQPPGALSGHLRQLYDSPSAAMLEHLKRWK